MQFDLIWYKSNAVFFKWYKSCILQSRISAYTGTKPFNHRTTEAASSFCGLSSLASKLDTVIFLLDSGAQRTQKLNRILFFCQIWYRMTKSHLGLFGKGETHDEFGPVGIVMEPSDWQHPFPNSQKWPKPSNHAPWIHCSSSMATSRHSRHYKVPSLSAPLLSCVLVNLGEFSLAEFLENIFRGSVYHSLYFLVFLHFINTFSHFTLVFSSSLLKVAGRLWFVSGAAWGNLSALGCRAYCTQPTHRCFCPWSVLLLCLGGSPWLLTLLTFSRIGPLSSTLLCLAGPQSTISIPSTCRVFAYRSNQKALATCKDNWCIYIMLYCSLLNNILFLKPNFVWSPVVAMYTFIEIYIMYTWNLKHPL